MKTGYVLARNNLANTFFTSSSSYDRPAWVPLTEATVYPTADMAQSAMLKLLKNGSYSACLRPINELMDMNPKKPDEFAGQGEGDDEYLDGEPAPEDQMKAGTLDDENEDDINLDDDEIESTEGSDYVDDVADDVESSLGGDLDTLHSDRVHPGHPQDHEENEQSFLSPLEQAMSKGKRPTQQNIRKSPRLGESEFPKTHKNQSDPTTTKYDSVKTKVDTLKVKQPISDPADAQFGSDIDALHNPFKTPATITKALKDGIKEFNDAADYNNGKDDAQASMALTIASAMQDILTDLEQGTHEGLKQAQLRITTYMNPITTNFPPEVIDFLYKGGRQPMSLKNIFYDKWDSMKKDD